MINVVFFFFFSMATAWTSEVGLAVFDRAGYALLFRCFLSLSVFVDCGNADADLERDANKGKWVGCSLVCTAQMI